MNQDLPDYHIRISKRAKYARLVLKPNRSLEVVLPMGMDQHNAEEIVRSQLDWIVKQQSKQETKEEQQNPNVPVPCIDLPLLNQSIAVQYEHSHDNSCVENSEGLIIFTTHETYIPKVLKYWLKQKASLHLPKMLLSIATEMDESYQSVSIRLQKTRWGSCSSQRRINLNAKLLLLPEALIRYVMVHELSHLQHLNHSQEFWQRVAQFDHQYAEKRQQLRVWEKKEPHWLSIES